MRSQPSALSPFLIVFVSRTAPHMCSSASRVVRLAERHGGARQATVIVGFKFQVGPGCVARRGCQTPWRVVGSGVAWCARHLPALWPRLRRGGPQVLTGKNYSYGAPETHTNVTEVRAPPGRADRGPRTGASAAVVYSM